jgi:uncharacterized protein
MNETNYVETSFNAQSPAGPLLGVHCAPLNPQAIKALTVVIVAGQPQTRVGAHRMFVELARHLAMCGINSIRFDCSGWGDSLGPVRRFEESQFDILTVVQAIKGKKPSESIALLGLCDGASAAWLSLPLLRADHRDLLALILINPWTDQKQFEAKAKISNYYIGRLTSKEFWGKLFRGRVKVSGALSEAIQSIKESQQTGAESIENLGTQLLKALDASPSALLLVLSEVDLTAQTFSAWMDHEERLRQSFPENNVLRHPAADHTFSDEDHWSEVCEWISRRLRALLKPA